jgi:hypothetical protein
MKTTAIFTVLAGAFAAAALAGGCSFQPGAPDMPTYEAAVRPIMMSHCVRCHGDPLLGDPTSDLLPSEPKYMGLAPDYLRGPPRVSVRFDRYEDTNCDTVDGGTNPACFRGAKVFASTIALYVGDMAPLPMPPPPAPVLTKAQVDTIARWAAEMPPLER